MRALIREVLQTILLAILIFMALHASVQNFRVEGPSMRPTLHEGQYLLTNKLIYYRLDMSRLARFLPFVEAEAGDIVYPFHPPQRGEVVVFRFPRDPSRDFIKRIVAVPGDTVEIRQGKVYVKDKTVNEPYVTMCDPRNQVCSTRLAEGEYYVLGDNRLESNDSRDWGLVPLDNIIGRAWISYWPVSEFGFLQVARGLLARS